MAHLLDDSKGFYSYMGVGAPAWHGLGKTFPEGTLVTAKEALQASGADFHVVKLPNVHIFPVAFDASGMPTEFEEQVSKDSFFTLRTDVNRVLGSRLGEGYQVLQNIECFDLVDEILQGGQAQIETAGVIDGGRRVFVCLKADTNIRVGENDIVRQYILLATSHDGSMSVRAMPTNVRVVCNNTLTAALGKREAGAITIRHSSQAGDRLKEAARVLGLIKDNEQLNTDNYNAMKEIKLSKADLYNYINNIFLEPKQIKAIQDGAKAEDVISTRKANIITEVLNFANNGTGQAMAMDGGGQNMWSAYNAVTGWQTRKKFKTPDQRINNMMFGDGLNIIQDAAVLALAPEKIQTLKKTSLVVPGFNLN